ncbi:hypothetical protein TCE0_033r08151 [Talaromyces pinophilus]|uniref:Uncharacterized protein n=1 Tax=Talaromyces pinophilus TaxID=128442 RepID=A0A6V8H950_TALPI|nr:hypothetical protein TCE0_033r08151 [Talaromyces pinophilus]
MDSLATTPSSSPSDYSFGQHFSDMTQNTVYSVESPDIEENACSLDIDQLAVLKPPHRLFSTPKDGRALYTINSKEWCYKHSHSADLYKRGLSGDVKKLDYQWESVYGASGVVYGIAKIFIAMCRNFRIDLHTTSGSILAYVEKGEQELENGSVIDFIFAIEDLYSCLYARLDIEIGLIHFCSSFAGNGQKRRSKTQPQLPEPEHIYSILAMCKSALEDPSVCSAFDDRMVSYHQNYYVAEMTRRYRMHGTLPLDHTGFRAHVYETINDPRSHTFRHWCQIYPVLGHLHIDILTFLSEKYIPMYPRTSHKYGYTTFSAPGPYDSAENVAAWAENMKCAHRMCALARIEGKAIGQLRREENGFNIVRYASEQKCICLDVCSCSRLCTRSGNTRCPCSGRWMRGFHLYQPDYEATFREKGTVMGELTYESLATLKRDLPEYLVQRELLAGINIIREEMIKQRIATQRPEYDIFGYA